MSNLQKVMGGVNPNSTVKAVLDAIGKRYLVEHEEADDGSWWYDLYSDGWLVQHALLNVSGNVSQNSYTKKKITLPKAFKDSNYEVLSCIRVPTTEWGNFIMTGYSAEDSSNFTLYLNTLGPNSYPYTGIAITAQGYAA